jgi:predicted  nucleic acid-binding Zn-ribbon protein
MSLALLLYRLQQVDNRLKQVSSRLAAIQSTLDNNAELQAAAQLLENAKSNRHQVEKSLKNAEFESANQRIKLELAESNLYSGHIHNPKELQDLQKDIASIKRNLGALEDQQLEFMMSVEVCIATQETAQKKYDLIQGKVISENATLNSELVTLQKELASLNAQRLAVLPAIDVTALNLYDNLRQKRAGLAVSQVIENACDTCGSSLTPGLAQSVRTSNLLVLCPMCGRILYSN